MQTLKMVNMIVIVENLHFCLCQLECDIPRTLCVYLSEGVHQPTARSYRGVRYCVRTWIVFIFWHICVKCLFAVFVLFFYYV